MSDAIYQFILAAAVGALLPWLLARVSGNWDKREAREKKLRMLLAEIQANLETAHNSWISQTLFAVPMDIKAWDETKDELFSLPVPVQASIQGTFSLVKKYNFLVSLQIMWDERSHQDLIIKQLQTHLPHQIRDHAKLCKQRLELCEPELRNYLAKLRLRFRDFL